MRLFAIIPRLPPLVDGIGDYALSLARLLRRDMGLATCFIVTDASWAGGKEVDGFPVRILPVRSTAELLNVLPAEGTDDAAVLLHYEGYGYANRGCPIWLVKALEQWRGADRGRTLVTMFHELYATGPLWTSAFWLSGLQQSLTARLARISDQWITSLESYAETVRRLSRRQTGGSYSLPVFSSIGEPGVVPPLSERQRRLVVFGTRGRRIEVYKRSAADLQRICERLGVKEILDVGRATEFDLAGQFDIPVTTLGELPGVEVSRLLLDAIAGVIDYPPAMLGKSTIFAGYCAHRIIPFVAPYGNSTSADGLQNNSHYWLTNAANTRLNLEEGQLIADRAFAWYQRHKLSVHGETFASCLHELACRAIENAAGVRG
jgi:hypothetical protein